AEAPGTVAQAEPRVGGELASDSVDHQPTLHAPELDEVGPVEKRSGLPRATLDMSRVDRREVGDELEVVGDLRVVLAEPEAPAAQRLEDLGREGPGLEPPLVRGTLRRGAEVSLPAALDEDREPVDHTGS